MTRYFLTLCFSLMSSVMLAQDFDESDPIFDFYKEDYTIEVRDGMPFLTTSTTMQIYYPTEIATRRLSYYVINLSSYDELSDVEVTIKDARGRKTFLDPKDLEISEGSSEDYFVNGSKEYKLNFKNLTEGSVVDLEYTVTTSELHFFQPLYFRLFLDARDIQYTLTYPEDMVVKLVDMNLSGYDISRGSSARRGYITNTFDVSNQKSVEYFEDGPSVPYYTPHIIPIIQSYVVEGRSQPYLRSPADLYHWYDSIVYLRGDSTSAELNTIAAGIKKNSKTKDDIIRNTYQWVQKNIRYVAYEAGSDGVIPRSPQKICERKFGDCKDMSNLMRKLLKLNGIESNLTWIGTRRIPYRYEKVYTMNTDNHMILSVPKTGGGWTLLDATDPNGIYGLPTSGIQGKEAMIGIDHKTYELYTAPIVKPDINTLAYNIGIDLEGTMMKLNTDMRAQGLKAGKIKNVLLYTSEREKEQLLKSLLSVNANQTELLNSEIADGEQDLEISTEHSVDGRVKKVANYLFVDPYVNRILPFGKIDVEDRKIPVELDMNELLTNQIRLNIPEGYEVAQLPEKKTVTGEGFIYTMEPTVIADKLLINESLKIDTKDLFFSVTTAKAWNDLVADLNTLYKTPIKLQKK